MFSKLVTKISNYAIEHKKILSRLKRSIEERNTQCFEEYLKTIDYNLPLDLCTECNTVSGEIDAFINNLKINCAQISPAWEFWASFAGGVIGGIVLIITAGLSGPVEVAIASGIGVGAGFAGVAFKNYMREKLNEDILRNCENLGSDASEMQARIEKLRDQLMDNHDLINEITRNIINNENASEIIAAAISSLNQTIKLSCKPLHFIRST